eukprot:gene15744-21865_t
MIVPGTQSANIFKAIKHDKYSSEDRGVYIFAANIDADSLCAAQQLQDIFHKEDLHYTLCPVESYDEVRETCEKEMFHAAEDLKTVVMINCGATEDVRSICSLHENVRLIIIDSHRPIWHGYNDENDLTIVILDHDDPVKKEEIPNYADGDAELRHQESESDEESDDGSDEEGSPSSSGSPNPRPKARESERKRRKLDESAQRLERRRLFLSQHMDRDDFDRWRSLLEGHVAAANGNIGVGVDEDERDGLVNNRRRDQMVVAKLDDLRLTLYRHWTLTESMMYTSYTAARLQTWRDKGKNNLNLLFAKMCVPQSQATAAYSTMKPQFRDSLSHQLSKHAAQWAGLNMQQLKFQSFELQYKNELRLSASDMVHALSAVLSKPRVEGECALDIYHSACDVLFSHRHMSALKAAMDRAKILAKAIVDEGGMAIQRNQVRGNKNSTFWYFNMADLEFSNKELLHHPIALRQLAVFLRDSMAQRSSFTKAVVVVGPPDAKGQCYTVSLRKKQQSGVMQNNPFAVPFSDAIHDLGIEFRSTFDNAMFKIDQQHSENFIEELKTVVNVNSRDVPDVDNL